jgi:hypothetical protein
MHGIGRQPPAGDLFGRPDARRNGYPRACGETMVPSETISPALARCA